MELILASTSPYRRELLDRLGVPYRAVAHRCDEAPAMRSGASPDEVARELARAKAESLAAAHPSAFILGSDQVVDLDGELLGKPGSVQACVAQLMKMRGRVHRLLTGVCLRLPGGETREALDVHEMRLRPLQESEIRRYVEAERPTDCAGSYKIEGRGIALMEEGKGRDFTAIVGLPLICVTGLLRDAGFEVP